MTDGMLNTAANAFFYTNEQWIDYSDHYNTKQRSLTYVNREDITTRQLNRMITTSESVYNSEYKTLNDDIDSITNLMEYRLSNDRRYLTGIEDFDETLKQLYSVPDLDIDQVVSSGVGFAMIIINAMQSENLLDTQLEGLQITQKQKMADSYEKMQEIREQVRRSRYKSMMQKFAEAAFMKWLSSNGGKITTFLISAAMTVFSIAATVFSAGALSGVAIACISILVGLTVYQACDCVVSCTTKKSITEHIVSGIDDEKLRMALQIIIDVALMVVELVASFGMGMASSSAKNAAKSAVEAGEAAKKTSEIAQEELKELKSIAAQFFKIKDNKTCQAEELSKLFEEISTKIESLQSSLKNVSVKCGNVTTEATKVSTALLKSTAELKDIAKSASEGLRIAGNSTEIINVGKYLDYLIKSAEKLANEGLSGADYLVNELKNLQKGVMKNLTESGYKLNKSVDNLLGALDDIKNGGQKALDRAIRQQEKINKFATGNVSSWLFRAAKSLTGGQSLSGMERAVVVANYGLTFTQLGIQLLQSLYGIGKMEERVKYLEYTAQMEYLRNQQQAMQEFYQTIIDHYQSDIENTMAAIQVAYEKATSMIQEDSETKLMIARNLVA